jgi:hypothetical protein
MSGRRKKKLSAAGLSAADDERLNTWVQQIAIELRPKTPVRTESDGAIRVGNKGSLAISDEAGVWYNHEAGKGGVTALALIEHLLEETSSPVRWAREFLRSHDGAGPLSQLVKEDKTDSATARAKVDFAKGVLSRAVAAKGTPAEKYLRARGLLPPYPKNIKFIPDARIGEGAMVVIVEDLAGEAVAIHMHYIDPDGQGSIIEPKNQLYALVPGWGSRGLFRLPGAPIEDTAARVLIAEGLEDALSLTKACPDSLVVGLPGVTYLGKADLPKHGEIVVFRDGDAPGSAADKSLRAGVDRLILAGHGTVSVTETPLGLDANDILQVEGPEKLRELVAAAVPWDLSDEAQFDVLAELSRFEYDRTREATAKKLGVRLSTLDKEVEKRRKSETEEADDTSLVADITPWPEEVEISTVLCEALEVIGEYVHLHVDARVAVVLWALHAHLHDLVSVSPRLAIQSPEKNCGKSTLLEAIALLVPRPLMASSITSASVFRLIEAAKPTLLLDESDQLFRKETAELVAVINSSHRKAGAFVFRTEEKKDGGFEPVRFSTWAPIVMAGIRELPATIQDRSLVVRMERALPGEVKKHLKDGYANELANVGRKFTRCAQGIEELPAIDLSEGAGLHNRLGDNWRPLLAIAELAGGDWPALALAAAKAAADAAADELGLMTRLLSDIREAFGTAEKMSSADLVESLLGLEDGPYQELNHGRQINQNWLAKSLRGVVTGKPGTIRIGNKTPKGYQRGQFEGAWDRYLPKTPKNPATAATPPQGESSLPDDVTNDVQQKANEPGAIPPGNKDQDREYW